MAPLADQAQHLKAYCKGVSTLQDGGMTLYRLEALALPDGCSPPRIDALLCNFERDGYQSRLFFAQRLQCPIERNWNFDGPIAGQRWFSFSWKVDPSGLCLRQLLASHLEGLTKC